ncbi:hypothetical protein QSJ18_19995 [Gordonia sp. ABSL1-1]|uniref:hypothetical protein n=1 Tax=Gordonia sp. ABSL1-1 TaxID=3053923 RepID=UPI002573A658|nr:hypothetical protein [Gordonia sp. ABSL1-1]MDL9939030.1 hypothetical protein [Gordonia sp. ABSL1-1]
MITSGIKRSMVGALIGAAALGPALVVGTGDAQAAPSAGGSCSPRQASSIAFTSSNKPLVCTNVGNRYRWVRVARIDPKVRRTGSPCSGAYPVAVNTKGKAVICADGRWRTQG